MTSSRGFALPGQMVLACGEHSLWRLRRPGGQLPACPACLRSRARTPEERRAESRRRSQETVSANASRKRRAPRGSDEKFAELAREIEREGWDL